MTPWEANGWGMAEKSIMSEASSMRWSSSSSNRREMSLSASSERLLSEVYDSEVRKAAAGASDCAPEAFPGEGNLEKVANLPGSGGRPEAEGSRPLTASMEELRPGRREEEPTPWAVWSGGRSTGSWAREEKSEMRARSSCWNSA